MTKEQNLLQETAMRKPRGNKKHINLPELKEKLRRAAELIENHEDLKALAKEHGVELLFKLEVWKIQDRYEAYDVADRVAGSERIGRGETVEEAMKSWLEWVPENDRPQ